MEIKYYLDWCPVSTLPIQNSLWKSDGLTRDYAKTIEKPHHGSTLFNRYPYLLMFEYAMRLDGIFIFRIGLVPNTSTNENIKEISSELSDIIKELTGHKHDFHIYPFSKVGYRHHGLEKFLTNVKNFFHNFGQLLCVPGQLRNQLDIDLHIRPVEVEDPFTKEFKEKTGKNFNTLSQIIDPKKSDTALAQLRATEKKDMDQRACLRLRSLFAGKKERCLIAYKRRDRLKRFKFFPVLYGIIAAILVFFLLSYSTELGLKTSLCISIVSGLGFMIFWDDKLQAPKLEVIQRALGFYAYANIYSSITESMYRNIGCGQIFNEDTGNFNNLISALKARLDLEHQVVANRKYIYTIIFALIATTFALTKLSMELEKLTEKPISHTAIGQPIITSKEIDKPFNFIYDFQSFNYNFLKNQLDYQYTSIIDSP